MPDHMNQTQRRPVYIVDGVRTPFLKAKNKGGPFSASDLAVQAGRELLARQPFSPTDLDEVVVGSVMASADEANIARVIAVRLGCGKAMPAWTVQRNCASGMQAIDSAATDIAIGRHDLVLAGGTEAMSRAPLLFNQEATNWVAAYLTSKDWKAKLKLLTQIRPHFLKPIVAILRGLRDPLVNLSMGQTAENLAYRFNISREAMDAFSVESHKRVLSASSNQFLSELKTVYDTNGQFYSADDGVRSDCTMERLAKLKPFFDKKFGSVTPGNSSQITDGAAMLILASEDAVKKYNLPVLAKITNTQWAGVDPAEMGLGPVHATHKVLNETGLSMNDIDYWEINEAFAAQVLGCVAAFADADYCKTHFGMSHPMGTLDLAKLNVDGGAVALGHPVGASGARIVLHLAEILKREKAKRGIASICIGGGQGGSMLIENMAGV